MYQTKVTNTQKYEDSQDSHIVTIGNLVIIKSKEMDSVVTKNDVVTGINRKPIIISETEEIKVGDWVLDELRLNVFKWDSEIEQKFDKVHYYKVLALPEHFSDKHLQAIVDGKIKDGDEVLVKCDYTDCERNEKGDCTESPNCLQWLHSQTSGVYKPKHVDCGMRPIILLDQQNHITLFPVK